MMDHILQRDWGSSSVDDTEFVKEEDIEDCVIERIIHNRFRDPLISSDEEEPVGPIDWDSIFNKKINEQHQYRLFVPGYRRAPPYPKLSSLSQDAHLNGIKVLCAQNPHILPNKFIRRPTDKDYRMFEEKKAMYELEQQQYLEWADHLWQTTNCARALHPTPLVELVYGAHFQMQAHRIQCMPKYYSLAAQIPLKAENQVCELLLQSDLIKVDISKLPKICYPKIDKNKVFILNECPLPKSCNRHPTGFQLPSEKVPSVLSLSKVHRELAQFAADNKAQFVASENAIKCLLETDRCWTLPLSVCEVIGPDGNIIKIVVLGNEFPEKPDHATMRSYKAFRHLLLNAFTDVDSKIENVDSKIENPDQNTEQEPIPQTSSAAITVKKRSYRNATVSHKSAVAFNSLVRKVADYDDSETDSDSEGRLEIDLDAGVTTDNQTDSEIEDNHTNNAEMQPRKIIKAQRRIPMDSYENKSNQESKQMDFEEHVPDDSEEQVSDNSEEQVPDDSEGQLSDDSDRKIVLDMGLPESDSKSDKMATNKSVVDKDKSQNKDSSNTSVKKLREMDEKPIKTDSLKEQNKVDPNILKKCDCKDTKFENPPPRSYKKVQIRNYSTLDKINVIIHSSHKLRRETSSGEVILEPILEYQLDIGATMQSPQKLQSLAFSLMLRENAVLTLVRVDGSDGELVSMENLELCELTARHAHCSAGAVANSVYTALNQLAELLPGHYLLRHEPLHGDNALLYSRCSPGTPGSVPLQSPDPLSPEEEARLVSAAPKLEPVLLPIHKFRRQLPLTFPYNKNLLAKRNANKVVRKPKLPAPVTSQQN